MLMIEAPSEDDDGSVNGSVARQLATRQLVTGLSVAPWDTMPLSNATTTSSWDITERRAF
jgi:hypothetical protein